MRTLHRAMMGVMMVAMLAAAVGVIQPWSPTAEAQHGQHGDEGQAIDPQEHFEAWVKELDLSEPQREVLAKPFMEAFVAMDELQRLHGVIASELNDVQREKLGQILGQMMGGSMGAGGHGGHQGEGHQ